MPVPVSGAVADIEAVIDGIANDLLSPGFIDQLKEEWRGREVQVPFRSPEVVYTDEVETPNGYPCAEVIAIEEADNEQSGAEDLTHEISVHWTINGDKEEVMARQLRRYMRATRRFFRQRALTPHVLSAPMRTGRIDYGLTAIARQQAGQSARFIKSASLQLFVQIIGR